MTYHILEFMKTCRFELKSKTKRRGVRGKQAQDFQSMLDEKNAALDSRYEATIHCKVAMNEKI